MRESALFQDEAQSRWRMKNVLHFGKGCGTIRFKDLAWLSVVRLADARRHRAKSSESASAICPYIFFVLRNAPSNTGTAHDAGDSADLNSRFIMTKLCGLAGFKDRAEDGTYSSARNSLSGLDATISENSGLLQICLAPCSQTRKKSCADWPLVNRRLPIAQEHGVFGRGSWQGKKPKCNTIDLVTGYPQLLLLNLKAKAGKEVAGVPK